MIKVAHCYTCGLDSYLANQALWDFKSEENTALGQIAESLLGKYRHKGISFNRVYFNLHSRYSSEEMKILSKNYSDDYYDIDNSINIGDLEKIDAHVPNRNLLLTTMAQAKYEADIVIINGCLDDRVSDNKKEFYEEYSKILSNSAGKDVLVTSLFWNIEKYQLVSLYRQDSTDIKEERHRMYKIINNTFSCFDKEFNIRDLIILYIVQDFSGQKHIEKLSTEVYGCLKCAACYRRFCALTALDLYVPFENMELAREYNTKVNPGELPNRYLSIKKYNDFLEWAYGSVYH